MRGKKGGNMSVEGLTTKVMEGSDLNPFSLIYFISASNCAIRKGFGITQLAPESKNVFRSSSRAFPERPKINRSKPNLRIAAVAWAPFMIGIVKSCW